MSDIHSTLSADAQKVTTTALQIALVDLIDLSLVGKQVHWNIVGPHFRSVHRQLDDLVAVARQYADSVAERCVTLGAPADGRPETVAADRSGPPMRDGQLRDMDGVHEIVTRLARTIERIREQMRATEEPDPVTENLLEEVLHDLEEQYWMFQAIAA